MRIVNAADVHVGWCRESTITSPFRPQHCGPFTVGSECGGAISVGIVKAPA